MMVLLVKSHKPTGISVCKKEYVFLRLFNSEGLTVDHDIVRLNKCLRAIWKLSVPTETGVTFDEILSTQSNCCLN